MPWFPEDVGDLDGGLPFDWEEEDLSLHSDPDTAGYENEVDEPWETAKELRNFEDRVTSQALEVPAAVIDDELPTAPSPPMPVDATPEAPLEEQPVRDENGIEVGTILPAARLSLPHEISVDIPSSTLVVPANLYQGEGTAASEREWAAVRSLLEETRRHNIDDGNNEDFIEFEFDNFAIHINATAPGGKLYEDRRYPCEMRPLHHLGTQNGCTQMFADGILSIGEKRFFIRQIPFNELPIGNYGVSEPTVNSEIWIRSKMNVAVANKQGPDIYYRLRNPAPEYRRYHAGFIWVADLAKHVVDYLSAAIDEGRRVTFREFRSDFSQWLSKMHGSSKAFSKWRRQYAREDFGTAIVPHLEYIYKEAYGVLGHGKVTSIYLWREIRDFTAFANSQKQVPRGLGSGASTPRASLSPTPTLVTPYIDDLFHHLPCGPMMEAISPSADVEKLRRAITRDLGLESSARIHTTVKNIFERTGGEVQVGDVISTPRDDNDEHWARAREPATGFDDIDRWFGLVQKVHNAHPSRQKRFDVIWIYRPIDTLCGTMRYPWNNELFLSDHCTCHDSAVGKIKEDEVLAIHKVHWAGSSGTDTEFFCRQTYLHDERKWITFKEQHLRCLHRRNEASSLYQIGETLLVSLKSNDNIVEPCELISLPNADGVATFRLLERRHRLEPGTNFPPNELVYTNETVTVKEGRIHGRCLVRFFGLKEKIPPPYDRNGVGNAFFITHRWQDGVMVPIEDGPIPSLRQGYNPMKPFRKLRGFDLFCGGGNFGRGLEEGGAIEMNWANDINIRAIHTYMANATNTVHPFAGSIDDLQRLALRGDFSEKVPEIGKVDFVSGGSPCPGFSRLTIDKATPEQRKNQSLVAAFASFVDTYRPRYGLLENVMEILQPKGRRGEDVFCQLICALVGLGYQAEVFLLDAWTYGSPQSRSRVFLCFAAPGLALPDMPLHSHSHYTAQIRGRGLGWIPNGSPMVERLVMPTPFKFVSAQEATADLPDIMDGKVDCCINFPDHRLANGITKCARSQLSVIPMHPYGMNFQTTWNNGKGVMTPAERSFFPEKGLRVELPVSRAWGRAYPDKVMQTITTVASPTDARVGRIMHWNQNRILTVMEARRAQGFRDHEVILGRPKDQWKVVGNSVAREVSLALGLSFRKAWLGSLVDGDEVVPRIGVERDLSDDVQMMDIPPLAESRTSISESVSPASWSSRALPSKRPLGSTLLVEQFTSKVMKTSRTQTASESRTTMEDGQQAAETFVVTSDIEIIEID
ncbi:cytosine-specific methyltransferase [Colletotrichum orchidophilum]|uniref:DNA (cytosine-5-)-methyltransferase n=1 Tax=Colletotrichum orchidophilum TaxID=1209926 RepID=A0A1G4BSH3_9PEZI|nr:cytosine-specific methyltransferase [Colletotrichum orchidophilum]OHF04412.1 cytosine-specific methyltransferase [Colletotrichum orchidophilum]